MLNEGIILTCVKAQAIVFAPIIILIKLSKNGIKKMLKFRIKGSIYAIEDEPGMINPAFEVVKNKFPRPNEKELSMQEMQHPRILLIRHCRAVKRILLQNKKSFPNINRQSFSGN